MVALTLALGGCSAQPAELRMTAFQGAWSDPELITENAAAISVVAVDGINFAAPGELTDVSDDAVAQLTAAHAAGLPAELMVGNFDTAIDDFSADLAHATLSDAGAATNAVTTIVNLVTEQGWDGVSVDMESLEPRDAAGLTAFVQELRGGLGSAPSVSIAIMLEDSAAGYAARGYDLGAISADVDRVILMAYDQHGPWDDAPGPVGSLVWQRAGLRALLELVPAKQVELGVAGYGYRWGPHDAGSLTVEESRAAAGDAATFDEDAGEWTATLPDGTVLWWSDARSLALREPLAVEFHVGGLALWSLGSADPLA